MGSVMLVMTKGIIACQTIKALRESKPPPGATPSPSPVCELSETGVRPKIALLLGGWVCTSCSINTKIESAVLVPRIHP